MVQFTAKTRYVRFSPYKLRPLVAVIRGKDVSYALNWLSSCALQRVRPLKRILESAVKNAQDRASLSEQDLTVQEFRVDQGPVLKYFKPGAKGRADMQRRRLSHLSVVLAAKESNKQSITKQKEA